jgi:hypothetical protein
MEIQRAGSTWINSNNNAYKRRKEEWKDALKIQRPYRREAESGKFQHDDRMSSWL